MVTSRYLHWTFLLILLVMLLPACGSDEGEAPVPDTEIPTAVSVAEATEMPPTLAPTSTTKPPLPPPVLDTQPTATNTAVPTPTATPLPVVLNSLGDFGTDRNPLTGELVEDPAVLQRRPIAVKISNNPPSYTRPQHGIGDADIVFEHITETNITRFTAIFYGKTPPDIGPVRSARLIDLEIPAMYDTALVMSGSHPLVSRALYNSDIGDSVLREVATGFYRTGDTSKPSEHTLHADPVGLWEWLDAYETNHAPVFSNSMAFNSTPPEGGDPAMHITLDYSTWSHVEWAYDVENGRYYRTVDGETFIDGNNGEQVSAANVIILYVPHTFDKEICVYHDGETCTLYTTEIQIWGQGAGQLMRDGLEYDITWVRNNRHDMLTFIDADGNVVPLQVGNTWFQVFPFYLDDPVIE